MEDSLTHDVFSQHLNSRFHVEQTPVDLELVEVSELKKYPLQEEFVIVFRGPSNAFLDQGTRSLSHELMGQFVIFMVPIRQDEHGFYYEAVFNRLHKQ